MQRFATLDAVGLNLHAVLDVGALPDPVRASLGVAEVELVHYPRLWLMGHGGRQFWNALNQRGLHGSHPVDTFVRERVAQWFASQSEEMDWRWVFPGGAPVGLQALGVLAGWHRPSPFWVGVQAGWGSWYAYRAVVLVSASWPVTPALEAPSPCLTCVDQPCVSACPAGAASGEVVLQRSGGALQACADWRLQAHSSCADRCLSRQACPVGADHRYSGEQTAYHYLQSLPALRAWRQGGRV